ncbi:hypothetical protein E2C01_079221 [Portunus trituberculatus]|uniref:Uncharacterized protein n=1 Tax=Portunus trituberculatus TaxID=210409 RepID=A0A5B7IKY1_PORTR|nr:hypothetical protein [Portunus trituberculatus]
MALERLVHGTDRHRTVQRQASHQEGGTADPTSSSATATSKYVELEEDVPPIPWRGLRTLGQHGTAATTNTAAALKRVERSQCRGDGRRATWRNIDNLAIVGLVVFGVSVECRHDGELWSTSSATVVMLRPMQY